MPFNALGAVYVRVNEERVDPMELVTVVWLSMRVWVPGISVGSGVATTVGSGVGDAIGGTYVPLLPPLAVMAAFGLLTMKRGAINAIDWFSVMVLTICAFVLWLFWFAALTGWPPKLAHNALKLLPGFKPELGLAAFFVAAAATAGWVALVHWRISRQPAVLWRAVVLWMLLLAMLSIAVWLG